MNRQKVEELRDRVPCGAVLDKAGFAVDIKESTRRALKYRRSDEIIIVIHDGRGWFDPLSEAKGDVFSLVEQLAGVGFSDGVDRVADLVAYEAETPLWMIQPKAWSKDLKIDERWRRRRKPWPGSLTWRYLAGERFLSDDILDMGIQQDRVREGPYGSMWAAHTDDDGGVTGWEERGPTWRGFATGSAKVLFRLGSFEAFRACVTEAAIDAMSLAAIERQRSDSMYLSTGGGWAPATAAAIRRLAERPRTMLVAATDNNGQGDVYAGRIAAIAQDADCGYERLRPAGEDWNEDLKAMERQGTEEGEMGLRHARRSRQG